MQPSTSTTGHARPASADAERHWRAGVAHGLAGRWKEAERAHARAVRAAPREALFWVNLGQSRRKLGDLDGALEAVEAALRASPGDGLAVQLRLALRLERHQYADAVVDAERVVAMPDAGHLHWADYGSALYQVGRHREAASALLRSLARQPDYFAAYVMLCNVFDRLGLHREAVECLRTALAIRPGWSAGHVGVIYHSLYGCDWTRLDADLAALDERLAQPGPHDVNPFLFLSTGADAAR
jgi:tetratricopeptide (TPR) repeat protein